MLPPITLRFGRALVRAALLLTLLAVAASGCAAKAPTPQPAPPQELPTRTPKATFTPVPTATTAPTLTPRPSATAAPTATEAPSATLVPTRDANLSPLTGLPLSDPALARRRVLAARIGNDPIIRPQEGLGQADIVYEEIMDGWTITRFTALYLDSDVQRIRPIRSARLSSLAITPQYDAALVHSGASDKIRWLISQAKFVDLDQFFHEAPYGVLAGFDWRGRIYTSVAAVHDYLRAKGLERDAPIEPLLFDAAAPAGQPAPSVHIPYPQLCVVDWTYSADKGAYLRAQQGQPHLEALDSQQIAAQNVIILYTEHRKTDIVEDSLGSTAIDIVFDGTGRAQVLRDGVVVDGYWARLAADRPIAYFCDAAHTQPIALKPGKTWIQLVPPDYQVAIK
ncbi:MAG: DUF3048 domain-containing protein [Chloroflexota bacterium]